MKSKTLILSILFLSLCSFTQAQDTKFRFGLNALPSISWLNTETEGLTPSGTDFNFGYGLLADYYFAENYALSSGLFVLGSGGSLDFPVGGDSVYYMIENDKFFLMSRDYDITYVTLPITIKLSTGEMGYMTYYGQFGIDMGFRAKARAIDTGVFEGINATSTQDNVNIEKDAALMRLGLNVGIGTEYNISGRSSIQLGLNYSNGFTNILKHKSNMLDNEDGSPFLQKAVSNSISLCIGVIF